MADRPFVHLHCHTHYSLLDGASRVPELVQHAKGLGMNAIAMTDHGNLFGAIEFYKECKEAGINPDRRLRSLRRADAVAPIAPRRNAASRAIT